MRRIVISILMVMMVTMYFAQKNVTKFLGIPVDGTYSEMKNKIIAK